MKNSILMSISLALAVTIWMLSGTLSNADYSQQIEPESPKQSLMKVKVSVYHAEMIDNEIIVQGQFEPRRRVQIRAETNGLVKQLPVSKGAKVAKGELLFALQPGDRQAQLKRASSDLQAKKLELSAMQKLKSKGLQAENQLKAAQAALDAALAEYRRIQLDIQRTQVRAPFSGLLESRDAEIGTLIQEGDVLGEVVDNSILKAVGYVPQQSAQALQLNQPVEVSLLDGRKVRGEITFIAQIAESQTRSFRIEADIPNPDNQFKAGISAEIRITVGQVKGHFISPSLLTLDDLGRIGVKAVDESNKVLFYPVALTRNEAKGVWVGGLPDHIHIIELGQNFVRNGEVVESVLQVVEVNL